MSVLREWQALYFEYYTAPYSVCCTQLGMLHSAWCAEIFSVRYTLLGVQSGTLLVGHSNNTLVVALSGPTLALSSMCTVISGPTVALSSSTVALSSSCCTVALYFYLVCYNLLGTLTLTRCTQWHSPRRAQQFTGFSGSLHGCVWGDRPFGNSKGAGTLLCYTVAPYFARCAQWHSPRRAQWWHFFFVTLIVVHSWWHHHRGAQWPILGAAQWHPTRWLRSSSSPEYDKTTQFRTAGAHISADAFAKDKSDKMETKVTGLAAMLGRS